MNMIFLIRPMLMVVCFIFFAPSSALSINANANNDYYKYPKAIIDNVSNDGARKVVNELYEYPDAWIYVLENIAKGSRDWLQVAVKLRTGSDAGASEMLTFAVGEALGNNPENVLEYALEEFQLEYICAAPDIDDNRYNTYKSAIKAVERRQTSIRSITNPKYINACKKCLSLLEKSKELIADYFEINGRVKE